MVPSGLVYQDSYPPYSGTSSYQYTGDSAQPLGRISSPSLSSCIFSSPLFSLTSKSIWWIEPLQHHFLHPRKTRCYIQSSRRFNRLVILPRHLELLYLPLSLFLSLSFSLFHSLFLLCFFSFESLLAVPNLDITQYGPPLSTTTWNLYIVPLSVFQTGTGTLLSSPSYSLHIPSLPLVPSPSPPLFSYILQLHRIQFMYVSLSSPMPSLLSSLSSPSSPSSLPLSSPLSLSLQHSLLALHSLRRLGGSWLVLG